MMAPMENPYFAMRALMGGTDSAVARVFGRSRQAVARWKTAGIPLSLAQEVEEYTSGEVTIGEIVRFRRARDNPTQP